MSCVGAVRWTVPGAWPWWVPSPCPLSHVLTAPPRARLSLPSHAARVPTGLRRGLPWPHALTLSSRHSGGGGWPCADSASHYALQGEPFLSCLLCPWPSWHQQYWPCVRAASDVHQRVSSSASRVPLLLGLWWGSQKAPHMKSGGCMTTSTLRASVPAPHGVGRPAQPCRPAPRGRRSPVSEWRGKWGAGRPHPAWEPQLASADTRPQWPHPKPSEEPLRKVIGSKWTW